MKDQYTRAVKFFTKRPWAIAGAVAAPYSSDHARALFAPVPGTNLSLTKIRASDWNCPPVFAEIRADERLPKDNQDITPEVLPVFAEWQRKLNASTREVRICKA
jgi:hypothetical protein